MNNLIKTTEFESLSDCEMIQLAVDRAAAEGIGKVEIPRLNPRSGEEKYVIDKSILLPSNMEIVLDNCVMTVADGAMCNIFRNENVLKEGYRTAECEQRNIVIRGVGHVVLDAAGHNDVFEWSQDVDGESHLLDNNIILFHNVNGFEVRNIEVRNQRWWALNFNACKNGYIADIVSHANAEFSNQDGINLRSGCHDITIERISGSSGDDLVALTAVGGVVSDVMVVDYEPYDIHDIIVRDIIGTSVHEGIVTLRCNDDRKMYNILVENVIESNFENENYLPYGTILIGQNYFFSKCIGEYGCIHDITVRNIYTKSGGTTITLGTTLVDSSFKNIRTSGAVNAFTTVNYDHDGCTKIVKRSYGEDGIKMKNVEISDVFADENVKGTLIDFSVMRKEDFIKELRISHVNYDGGNKILDLREDVENDITLEGEKII